MTYGAQGGDPAAVYGDPTHFDGTQSLNSGFLGQNAPDRVGTSFMVTFTKVGAYAFSCALSGRLGMKATIVVRK